VGEIFMRTHAPGGPTFAYIGANALPTAGADHDFRSIGDLGWVDADGYLYIADRRTDMIVSGGANVYPAEVEAALHDHAGIADLAVIGLPDAEWGRRVHAVIQPVDPETPPDIASLHAYVRARIADYKCPRSWEFVTQLPRNEAGKIRRSALVSERESTKTHA
jgi:bile acid-coenzyme A ligase